MALGRITRLILIAAFVCAQAQASILLTTPYCVTGPSGIAVACSANATATSKTFNWITNAACITYSFGAATASGGIDQTFTPTAPAPTVTMCLNITPTTGGQWFAGITNGAPISSGTLTSSQLSAAIVTYTGALTPLRDSADYFASSSNAVVNISNTTINWVSGNTFTGAYAVTSGGTVTINGTTYTVTGTVTATSFSVTAAPGDGSNVALTWLAPGQGGFLPGTQPSVWGSGDL